VSAVVPTYGTPDASTSPQAALLAEIARTAGVVDWLAGQVGELKPDQLIRGTKSIRRIEDADGSVKTITEAGTARHELLQLFIEERRHLHALCRDALNVKSSGPTATGGWPSAV
jgi:hypothetical protein